MIIFSYINKKTYYYKNIVKNSWKQIYLILNQMIDWRESQEDMSEEDKDEMIDWYKPELEVWGNLINSIFDLVNNLNKKQGNEEKEKEGGIYRYNRFDFNKIKKMANMSPEALKYLIKINK